MVTIEVENLIAHMTRDFKVGRVPCIGEHMIVGNDVFEVVQVFHYTDVAPDDRPVALVRVR